MSVMNGIHVLWTPGEIYDSDNEVYCGFMMESGSTPCQTNPKVELANSARSVSADAAARFVAGRGTKIARKYPLCFEAWMVARVTGYCIPTGETVGGQPRVWIETTTDLSNGVYDNQQIKFENGELNLISTAARSLEVGTQMYNVYLAQALPLESGVVEISAAYDPIGLEHWWMERMQAYFGTASVGVVKEVNADRDIDTGVLTNVLWTKWYETRVLAPELVDVHHQDFDYLTWSMAVEQRAIAAPTDGAYY